MDKQERARWERTIEYVGNLAGGLYSAAPEHWTADQVALLETVMYVPEAREVLRRWTSIEWGKLRASAEE